MPSALRFLIFLALANLILVNALQEEEEEIQLESGYSCSINFTKDASKTQVLYLQTNSPQWWYPKLGVLSPGPDGHLVKIGCPGGFVQAGDSVTTLKTAVLDCADDSLVQISGTFVNGTFDEFGCSGYQAPVTRLNAKKTPNGMDIAEVGYFLGLVEFLPIIQEVAVKRITYGYIPKWAHYSINNFLDEEVESDLTKQMVVGPLSNILTYRLGYNRALQRLELKKTLKDKDLVEFIMPLKGTQGFVPAKLANPEDFYYEAQKNGTYFYELTTPVWKSVAEGNWQLTGKLVRDLVRERKHPLDVYTGTYLALYLPNKSGMVTYISMPGGLRPAQFLFRIVVDRTSNEGVVLITVNNPFLKQADFRNVICTPVEGCAADYQTMFNDFRGGYTYCCDPSDFVTQALRLGLPIEVLGSLTLLKV